MRHLLLLLTLLFCASLLSAANTQILDTDSYPFNGQPASCTLVYQLMAGQPSTSGATLISVPKNYQIVGGNVNLSRAPSDQINQPAGGTYYQITNTCWVDGGQVAAGTETWVVPTPATSLSVRAVRSGAPPPGPGTISIRQVACPTGSAGQGLAWNGLSFMPGAVLLS